jgi:hypothetical protein
VKARETGRFFVKEDEALALEKVCATEKLFSDSPSTILDTKPLFFRRAVTSIFSSSDGSAATAFLIHSENASFA